MSSGGGPSRRGLLVYNPAAGSSDRRRQMEELAARWAPRGLLLELLPTLQPGETSAEVRRRAAQAPDLVAVCGGDGTVGEVAAALVGSAVPLAILPAGTANVVARELGLGRSVAEAERHLASRRTAPVAVWPVAGRVSLLGVGVGYDARVMARANPRLKRLLGRAGIGVTALVEALRYDFPPLSVSGVDAGGRPFEREATLAVAANTRRYGGEFLLAPGADPSDDLLDLVLFTGRSTAALVAFHLALLRGGGAHLRRRDVERLEVRSASILSLAEREVEAQVDGDAAGTTPLTVGPVAGTVRFVVPAAPAT